MRKPPISLHLVLFLAGALWPAVATAQDGEGLRLFAEPTSYTDVIDAFDGSDPFDLNVSLGFTRSQTTGTIQRERNESTSNPFRAENNYVDIAEYDRLVNTLELGVDVGLYHDLALYARLPIVLSDERKLSSPDDRTATEANADLVVTAPGGGTEQLFTVPFQSPTRSGIDHMELGLAWAIFNQHRDPEYPTWLIMLEGHFGLGEEMNPCADGTDCDPGISRGTHALRLETRASHRFRYVEPYAGLAFHIEFPAAAADDFEPGGDLAGYMNTLPPRVGELTAGLAIIPWEQRARWQRFVVDVRLSGQYISEGHGYSPLYDALGTSSTGYLTEPNNECADPSSSSECQDVQFTGLTDMQSHGRIGTQLTLEMQAARYVQFEIGGALYYTTGYLATFADACNPNVSPGGPIDRRGTCRNGIINPHHRSVIDLPGNRFRVESALTLDFFASATAQF